MNKIDWISSRKRGVVLIMVMVVVSTSCSQGNRDSPGKVQWHPVEENIPHYNRVHIPVEASRLFDQLEQRPEELELLYSYLQNPDDFRPERLEGMGSTFDWRGGGHEVVSFGNNRLVILNKMANHLMEYNLRDHSMITLAEFGRGPQDIHMPVDIVREGDKLWVVRQDGYLSRFDCQFVPCKYEEAISVEVPPVSFTPGKEPEIYAYFGKPVVRSNSQELEETLRKMKAVHIIDKNGRILEEFGDMYDAKGIRLVFNAFSSGQIGYVPSKNVYMMTFDSFPFIYFFDADNLELIDSYEIMGFQLRKQRYDPHLRGLWIGEEGVASSTFRTTGIFAEHLLWIEIVTSKIVKMARTLDDDHEKRAVHEYYVVDLRDQTSYFMGEFESVNVNKDMRLTRDGLAIFNYEDGFLYWIGI